MSGLEIALAAVRGLQTAGTFSLFGALVFRAVIAEWPMRPLRWWSLALALAAAAVLAVLQAAVLLDAESAAPALAATPAVLLSTRFGQTLLVRATLLALAQGLATGTPGRPRACLAAGIAALAVAAPVAAGHAGAEGDPVPMAIAASHQLAAGAWLGGLLPLWVALRRQHDRALGTVRRFSWLATVAVVVLLFSAVWQARWLVGDLAGLVGTDYGHLVLVKLTLLVGLLALATWHRWGLAPRLTEGPRVAVALRRSVLAETALGLATVLAAALLAEQLPAAHAQPEWPFALRLGAAALADPAARREVAGGLIALGLALLVVLTAMLLPRRRTVAIGLTGVAALVIAWLAVPHLRPLLIEAHPTSFYHSPTGFAATSIAAGGALFGPNCAGCHGGAGRGDGPMAARLPLRPPDLTADHLWTYADGDLFWLLSHGKAAPDGHPAMPGFAATLDEDARWALIDYVRASNAGAAARDLGTWFRPTLAPDFPLECPDGRATSLAALRGRTVRIVAGAPPADDDGMAGIVTVSLGPGEPSGRSCGTDTPAALAAYATLTGGDPAALAGTWILVDASGWLRRVLRPDHGTISPAALSAALDSIQTHPITQTTGAVHVHHS